MLTKASKKIITATLLTLTMALVSHAQSYQKIRAGLMINYEMVAMDQVNTQLETGSNVTKFGPGISGMFNLDVALAPFLMVGGRSGLLYTIPAEVNFNPLVYTQKTTVRAALVPILAGITAVLPMGESPLSVSAGIYGGYGFCFVNYYNDINILGEKTSYTQPFTGGKMIGELLATVTYKGTSPISVNIHGGYRFEKISELSQSKDVNYTLPLGVTLATGSKGDVLKVGSDNLAFDFSGLSLGVGISQDF